MLSSPTRRTAGFITTLALGALVVLTGCDFGGGTSSGTGASASASQSSLSQILQRGTLRIGTITGNAPFESLDSSGNLVGYDIDIVNLLAKEMGVNTEFIKTDVAGRVTLLQTRKADVVVGSFTRTHKRSEVISFTDPINLEYVALIASAGRTDLNSVSDFNKSGIKIAVTTGGTQQAAVAQALPKATAVQLPGIADELQAVESGKADGAGVANTQIGVFMKENPGKFKTISGALSAFQEDCIGIQIGDSTWWLYVNQFVHDINNDGTTYNLYQKWFGPGSTPGPFSLPPAGNPA